MKVTSIVGNCEWCGTEFAQGGKRAKFCSIKCAQSSSNEKNRLKKQEEFLIEHGADLEMPVCKVCGWKAFDLTTHITKFHKIPMKDYYKQFSCDTYSVLHPERREERSERKLGEKNPFFDHGGKFSAVSKNSVLYEGLSDKEKMIKIKEVQEKQKQGREEGEGYTTRLDYWIKKGFTEDEAHSMLHKRQRTFSLDICVAKYGEEEGFKRWKARQDIWLTSYYDKTEEELEDIFNRKGIRTHGTSTTAVTFFDRLRTPTCRYCDRKDNKEIVIKTELRAYSVDYCEPEKKKVIEFYGDIWHANPILFEGEDYPIYWSTTAKSAQEMWETDKFKLAQLNAAGYDVLVIWELDWKQDPDKTIQRCKDFLGI